jgi:hypothetical protein
MNREVDIATLLSLYDCPMLRWYISWKDIAENVSGVYILTNGDETLYVGMSIMVRNRVAQHKRKGFPFNRIGVVEVGGILCEVVEVAAIGLLQPRFNNKWNPRNNKWNQRGR